MRTTRSGRSVALCYAADGGSPIIVDLSIGRADELPRFVELPVSVGVTEAYGDVIPEASALHVARFRWVRTWRRTGYSRERAGEYVLDNSPPAGWRWVVANNAILAEPA